MMKKIILYGAGKRGKAVAELLDKNHIQIAGFCDSFKTGSVMFNGGGKVKEKPIILLNDINGDDYIIVVTIVDYEQADKVREKIIDRGIEITTVEKLLYDNQDMIRTNRQYIAVHHNDFGEDYFKTAESTVMGFWEEDSIFKQMFNQLNIEKVVELACGRGRHVPQYILYAEEVMLVDILEKNILYCKERFKAEPKVHYYVNNGYDLKDLKSEGYTALFTYDAMVHFEMLDVFQYLKETYRILISGGKALFHHSNNTEDYRVTFSTGKSARNYMSKQLFAHLADRAGFLVVEQHVIDWGKTPELDCLTLVEKP